MSARFLLNKSIALERYNTLKKLGVKVAYSVKTNPLIAPILEKETDSEFTIHAMESLDAVKEKGRLWYYVHAWDRDEIEQLFAKGVRRFIIDNETDLEILENALKTKDEKISLLLRQKLQENTVFTGRHYVFGMDAKVVNQRIAELRKNPRIEKLGVHVHRKSQNVSEWSLAEEIGETLTEDTLKSIDFINIGGGMPTKYSNSSDAMLKTIFERIRE
ncbi:MAG: decarboxylase, partial [Candidatus Aenigmarchaeota archaeon]|nr:decarboxylase [Candidatus Aenigmarchaeota archaeon]